MKRGRRGRDRMVVGFTTTFMQSVSVIGTNESNLYTVLCK
jgi:hypothetical protein